MDLQYHQKAETEPWFSSIDMEETGIYFQQHYITSEDS